MTRIDIDLIDSKIHLTSWPRKLSLNAEEALRVYEAIGAWLELTPKVTRRAIPLNPRNGGPLLADDLLEFIDNTFDDSNEFIAGAG